MVRTALVVGTSHGLVAVRDPLSRGRNVALSGRTGYACIKGREAVVTRRAHRCHLAIGLSAMLLLGGAATARAEPGVCAGLPPLADNPDLAIGRILGGAARVNFIKTDAEQKGCPDATVACRAKAFVVPGDRVILAHAQGAFVCADYVAVSGADRAGWLPAVAVERQPAAPIGLAAWPGTWVREEASITIKPARTAGALAIEGDATWGAFDPERVKRGGINVGSIAAEVTPVGADLGFTVGADATLPVTAGDPATDCRVWMRRLGPHLLVDDNGNCGGMNVTFGGIYRRKP